MSGLRVKKQNLTRQKAQGRKKRQAMLKKCPKREQSGGRKILVAG